MKRRINWYEPVFGEEEKKIVCEVLESGYVNEGPKTTELEENITKFLGVKHCTLTTSGTVALYLAIKADQIVRGYSNFEVIVPDLTMIATPNAAILSGGEVELVDIEEKKFTINSNLIKNKICSKTKIILPVHICGRSCNMGKLEKIAKEEDLTIIEDVAGCLGSKYDNKYLGTFGKVGCFSLQANKIISCGQGGFVVTNDDEYFDAIKRLKDFGRLERRETVHEKLGYNFKFNDILAGVTLGQFKSLDIRRQNLIEQWKLYKSELKEIEEISFPKIELDKGEIPLYVDVLAKNKEKLINYLNSNNIHPRPCWTPIHKNPPYYSKGEDIEFIISSFVSKNSLWLPNGPAINNTDIKEVCKKIKEF